VREVSHPIRKINIKSNYIFCLFSLLYWGKLTCKRGYFIFERHTVCSTLCFTKYMSLVERERDCGSESKISPFGRSYDRQTNESVVYSRPHTFNNIKDWTCVRQVLTYWQKYWRLSGNHSIILNVYAQQLSWMFFSHTLSYVFLWFSIFSLPMYTRIVLNPIQQMIPPANFSDIDYKSPVQTYLCDMYLKISSLSHFNPMQSNWPE